MVSHRGYWCRGGVGVLPMRDNGVFTGVLNGACCICLLNSIVVIVIVLGESRGHFGVGWFSCCQQIINNDN